MIQASRPAGKRLIHRKHQELWGLHVIKRIELSGLIVSTVYSSNFFSEETSMEQILSCIKECYIEKNVYNYNHSIIIYNLNDVYSLYDNFIYLEDPKFSVNEFLSTVISLPETIKDSILKGLDSYMESIK